MPVISQKKKVSQERGETNVAKSFFNSIREQNWAEKIKTDPERFHGAKESLLRKADSSSCPAPSFPRVTLAAFGNLIYPAIISQWQEVEMLDEISNSLSCNLTSSVCVCEKVCVCLRYVSTLPRTEPFIFYKTQKTSDALWSTVSQFY